MKKYFPFIFLVLMMGCASGRSSIKATSSGQEVVVAEGSAPIVKGDLAGAKNAALHDAMKNALGLVVGVYVSQEALVSKAMLIEDNITSQTEGYIEKYDILNDSHDENFYKVKIKALVRKEDLSAKLKSLELEPKKLGNPVIAVSIKEYVDGRLSDALTAENELKNDFSSQGFVVSESTGKADIVVTGKAESSFNTDQGLGGLISYRASINLKTIKSSSKDLISSNSETSGGVDSSKDVAANIAILNAAKRIGSTLPKDVLTYLRERSTTSLTISNVDNINVLNDFIRSVRTIIEIRDAWVRNYANGVAEIDLDMKKGGASDAAKRLEQLTSFKVKVNSTSAFAIEAELIK